MLFTLEALQAGRGDSLVLHFGRTDAPRFIVVDGGPATVYPNSLKPRLTQLRQEFKNEDDDMLDVEMVMVSHIDDDHINGILEWFEELDKNQDQGLPYNIQTLWFNSFDEIVGNAAQELKSRLASVGKPDVFNADPKQAQRTAAIVASVGQGRDLRSVTDRLGIGLNRGFSGLVMAPQKVGEAVVDIGAGLTFRVLSPSMKRLRALSDEWERDVRLHPGEAVTAAFVDRSVANLSSIVVLAEMKDGTATRRMLLTGDARGDDIAEGLGNAGLLTNGKLHVDLLKFPHHGSNRNMRLDFLQNITADHYVISADGEYDNPDKEVVEWLAKARGMDPYTIYITNEHLFEPKKKTNIERIIKGALAKHPSPNRTVVFRKENDLSVKVDLMDRLPF
jgi:hypothetical protein